MNKKEAIEILKKWTPCTHTNTINGNEAVLVRVECQNCGGRFTVSGVQKSRMQAKMVIEAVAYLDTECIEFV